MPISFDEVQHVARLARLELDDAELMALQGELNALIGHFQDIQDLEVAGIPGQSHAMAFSNVWSADEPRQGLSRGVALRGGPKTRAGLFVVPTILED